MAIVKANMYVMLGRLGMVGEAVGHWGKMEEARMRWEMAFRPETTGRRVVRRVQFW